MVFCVGYHSGHPFSPSNAPRLRRVLHTCEPSKSRRIEIWWGKETQDFVVDAGDNYHYMSCFFRIKVLFYPFCFGRCQDLQEILGTCMQHGRESNICNLLTVSHSWKAQLLWNSLPNQPDSPPSSRTPFSLHPRKLTVEPENTFPKGEKKEKHLQLTNFWFPAVCFPGFLN